MQENHRSKVILDYIANSQGQSKTQDLVSERKNKGRGKSNTDLLIYTHNISIEIPQVNYLNPMFKTCAELNKMLSSCFRLYIDYK